MDCTTRNIKYLLSELEERGYIKRETKNECFKKSRKIWLAAAFSNNVYEGKSISPPKGNLLHLDAQKKTKPDSIILNNIKDNNISSFVPSETSDKTERKANKTFYDRKKKDFVNLDVAELKRLWKNVDIDAELAKLKHWLETDTKGKRRSGVMRTIKTWMDNAECRNRRNGCTPNQPQATLNGSRSNNAAWAKEMHKKTRKAIRERLTPSGSNPFEFELLNDGVTVGAYPNLVETKYHYKDFQESVITQFKKHGIPMGEE